MPYTLNGCGTRYYGKRDEGPDGSFVVTEWITLVWVPLIPIRSLRVLPSGEGTNLIVWNSQSYRTMKVPLCWPQVRNIYMFSVPIILLVIAFNWNDLRHWVNHDILKRGPVVEAAPIELPMDDAQSAKACGNVLKLQADNFKRLNLHQRMVDLVKASDFTDEEMKDISQPVDLEQDAFSGYAAGYLTWDKRAEPIRADLIQKMTKTVSDSAAKYPGEGGEVIKDYGTRNLAMVMKAFDIGRQDGRKSPCPF